MPLPPQVRGSLEDRLGRSRRELRGSYRGTRERAEAGTRAIVVGGGLAGVAAACVLAERGVKVQLVERHDRLGGRMASAPTRLADRALHVAPALALHRHFYNTRALLARVDPELVTLRGLDDYVVLGADGASTSFAELPASSPLNAITLLRRMPSFSFTDLRRLSSERMRQLILFDVHRHGASLDGLSAATFLTEMGLPAPTSELLARAFAHASFDGPDAVSAAEFLQTIQFQLLANPEGLAFDVLEEPAEDALFAPMERYLRSLDVDVLVGEGALRVARERGDRVRVETTSGALEADGLVLALDVSGLRALVEGSPGLAEDAGFARSIAQLEASAPYALLRLGLAEPLASQRRAYVRVATRGSLDAISIHDRFEGESRRHALRTGGSVVQLQALHVPREQSDEAVRAELLEGLFTLYPEARTIAVRSEALVRRDDCPAFAPGSFVARPRVATPYGNIALAGDLVKLPFASAMMERAAASGFMAANVLLDRWDVRGEALYTLPPRSLVPGLMGR